MLRVYDAPGPGTVAQLYLTRHTSAAAAAHHTGLTHVTFTNAQNSVYSGYMRLYCMYNTRIG